MRIELLAFDGCPNVTQTIEVLQQALQLEGVEAPIHRIDVDSSEEALRLRFLGSPSVRVDGMDVESIAAERTSFGVMCRTYNGAKTAGVPPIEIIRAAIRRAALQR